MPNLKVFHKKAVVTYTGLYHRQWCLYFFPYDPFIPCQPRCMQMYLESDLPPLTCLLAYTVRKQTFINCANVIQYNYAL